MSRSVEPLLMARSPLSQIESPNSVFLDFHWFSQDVPRNRSDSSPRTENREPRAQLPLKPPPSPPPKPWSSDSWARYPDKSPRNGTPSLPPSEPSASLRTPSTWSADFSTAIHPYWTGSRAITLGSSIASRFTDVITPSTGDTTSKALSPMRNAASFCPGRTQGLRRSPQRDRSCPEGWPRSCRCRRAHSPCPPSAPRYGRDERRTPRGPRGRTHAAYVAPVARSTPQSCRDLVARAEMADRLHQQKHQEHE